MPVHDWTKVRPGTFHDFHGSWITHLKESLNGGLLPDGFYALSEQPAEEVSPDVLALQSLNPMNMRRHGSPLPPAPLQSPSIRPELI